MDPGQTRPVNVHWRDLAQSVEGFAKTERATADGVQELIDLLEPPGVSDASLLAAMEDSGDGAPTILQALLHYQRETERQAKLLRLARQRLARAHFAAVQRAGVR
jgi:hypothetical protein